ncbi:hypothetical protein GLAREA_08128 [Glarea lozoyensis ATCC 20868]|uniref:Uncharacterized protein n=1 Tax=Glarea lozoyensis (strain ATCC 20868 / MF5171) TaxID=1116229 RepID=S3CCN0_GLAL2|nr:uncharacterized protein GLAREA_08128 [Glarea lozoyensis ATCC 20868]EPE24277.1 hypothetical protein GLAREA_08128 [Glarea lozoyensis ATCC 20868]
MASLSNVIKQLEASKILLEKARLPPHNGHAKMQIATKLKKELSRLNVQSFHRRHLQWIFQHVKSAKLVALCTEVAVSLESTVEQIWSLHQWASSEEEGDPRDGRALALIAIQYLIWSFREFEIIPGEEDLQVEPNKSCILRYLKKALQLVLTLSPILGSSWYGLYEEILDHLDSFHFDNMDDYKRADNPTLEGVIDEHWAVPTHHLPYVQGRPALYRYDGHWGAKILVNQPD